MNRYIKADILLASDLVPAMNTTLTLHDKDLTVMAVDPLTPGFEQDIVVDHRRLLRGQVRLTFLEDGRVQIERNGETRLLAGDQHWLLETSGDEKVRSRLLIWNAGAWSTSQLATTGR